MEAEVPDSGYPLGRPERPADLLHWLSVIKEDAVGFKASDFRQFSQRIFYGWGQACDAVSLSSYPRLVK